MKFEGVLSHLDRAIAELRRAGGPDLASVLMLEVVRRNLIESDHPESVLPQPASYFRSRAPTVDAPTDVAAGAR